MSVVASGEVFKSVNVVKGDKIVRLNVGDNITFTTQTGVVKTGILKDLKGKEEKAELTIQPVGEPQKETWLFAMMDDDSLDVADSE
jgi:hypothetical protein